MPQDGRKSARYRPFVSCDDPKGVVECGTIRKSKLSSYQAMGPKTDRLKNPNKTLAPISEEKDHGDDFRGRASIQLSEVSKGAQKLNHVIEAWSKNLPIEGEPKDIAKDLLKGALDLQESLMMLGKLQAASKYVSKLKKKKKQDKGNNNNGGQEETRVFPKQEVPSKEKIEELKEIIRSSFERQNLLRLGNGGKGHFSQFNQEPDIPSTSSSHSSSSYNEKIDKKLDKSIARGPGIIAKLMGLEEISSTPMQKKPLFHTDMQMPKLKDQICEDSNGDKKKKTLKEVLDTMHFKGLLKDNSIKSHRVSCDNDMMPPIVLIKPLHIPPPKNDVIIEVKSVEFCDELESTTERRRSMKCKEKVDQKVKPSMPSNRRPIIREVSNKKPGENEKANKSDRKSLENRTPQNRVKEIVKPESRPTVVVAKKGHDSSKKGRENGVKKEESLKQRKELRTRRAQTDQKKIPKKDQKKVNEPKEAKLAKGDAVLQKKDEIMIDSSLEVDIAVNTNSIHIDQQSIQDGSETQISDIDAYRTCTPVKGYDYGNRRSLLLSSQTFLTCAEDLFSCITSSPTNPEKPDSQPPNERLYIDCATELIERKSLDVSEAECFVLLPWHLRSSAIYISMEKLVEEVCDGIEILSSYWSSESDGSPEDGLYAVLKRDLNQNRGMVGSKLWDMGWNRGFSSDDVEKVVIQMEEMILSCLVQELFRGQR